MTLEPHGEQVVLRHVPGEHIAAVAIEVAMEALQRHVVGCVGGDGRNHSPGFLVAQLTLPLFGVKTYQVRLRR